MNNTFSGICVCGCGYYNNADNLVAIILHFGKEVLNINYFIFSVLPVKLLDSIKKCTCVG